MSTGEPDARERRNGLLELLPELVWDCAFAAVCAVVYVAWWQDAPWATEWLERLRWWPAFIVTGAAGSMLLFIVFAPDAPDAASTRTAGEWGWIGGIALLIVLPVAGFAWSAQGDLWLLVWMLGFVVARALHHLLQPDRRAFGDFAALLSYSLLAAIPLGACMLLHGLWIEHDRQNGWRVWDLDPYQLGSLHLVAIAVPFHLGLGAFWVAGRRWPRLLTGDWLGDGRLRGDVD